MHEENLESHRPSGEGVEGGMMEGEEKGGEGKKGDTVLDSFPN